MDESFQTIRLFVPGVHVKRFSATDREKTLASGQSFCLAHTWNKLKGVISGHGPIASELDGQNYISDKQGENREKDVTMQPSVV